nr:premnaspirodiene oxygenase-like [Ipomoea batatas]
MELRRSWGWGKVAAGPAFSPMVHGFFGHFGCLQVCIVGSLDYYTSKWRLEFWTEFGCGSTRFSDEDCWMGARPVYGVLRHETRQWTFLTDMASWSLCKKKAKRPPGPWKLPIIGNLFHLGGSSLPAHRLLRDLAKRHGSSSGLMHLQIGEISAVVVSSREMAKEFLRTHDLAFASRPQLLGGNIIFYNCSDIVLSPYGDHWRQMRKICVMELLKPKLIRSFSSIRNDEIHRLLTHVRSYLGSPVNLVFTGREELIKLVDEIAALLGGFEFADVFPSLKFLHNLCGNKNKFLEVYHKTDAIIENIIKQHEKNLLESGKGSSELGADDIIDVLIKLEKKGGLQLPITHDIIKAVILCRYFQAFAAMAGCNLILAICAGFLCAFVPEATYRTYNFSGCYYDFTMQLNNPKQRVFAKAQAEVREAFKGKEMLEEDDIEQLEYLKLVVKETLRCHPPIPLLIPRECREETAVCGYTIPQKARVLINVWAIGLAFGFANTVSPLAHLLYNFDWKLPAGVTVETLDMTERPGMAVAKKNKLFLIPTPPVKC